MEAGDVIHTVHTGGQHMGWGARREVVPQVPQIDMGGVGGGQGGVDVLEIPVGVRFIKVGHQIIKVDGSM